ncbi:MAG TPA: polysaccharide pyruvyl transferase family protein [Sinorhizobium sp.]|nr:polysaccharide pyruvyl transferase family protein [Sinorhizobium sp.]
MKVVVENTVCLNTGDAAILLAIRHIVKSIVGEAVEFLVFDSQPKVAARLYPKEQYPDIELRKLPSEAFFKYKYDDNTVKNALKQVYNQAVFQALRHAGSGNYLDRRFFSDDDRESLALYRDADLVITTGGTYLVENYSLERRINEFKVGEMLGKRPVFFTQSLGPFDKPYNRRMLQPVFARSPLILLRDAYSRDNILDLVDDPGKCHVVADAVFALADVERVKALLVVGRPASSGRVGISVRHWRYVKDGEGGMGRYIDSVREIATSLVRDHGKEVTFLSTCQGVPEYAHDDSKTAELIRSRLAPEIASHVTVDASFHTPEQLMATVKDLDFVVATRMHMMIMSLCVGTPVLPIAYEFKTKELAKRIGVSDLLLDIDTVTPDEAAAKLARFAGNLDHYRALSLKAVLKEHASAMSAADLIRPLVGTSSAKGAEAPRDDIEQHMARRA